MNRMKYHTTKQLSLLIAATETVQQTFCSLLCFKSLQTQFSLLCESRLWYSVLQSKIAAQLSADQAIFLGCVVGSSKAGPVSPKFPSFFSIVNCVLKKVGYIALSRQQILDAPKTNANNRRLVRIDVLTY